MNVEIEKEAAQFHFRKYFFQIFDTVPLQGKPNHLTMISILKGLCLWKDGMTGLLLPAYDPGLYCIFSTNMFIVIAETSVMIHGNVGSAETRLYSV